MIANMNLRELFSKYPLDCASFGAEWLRRWEAVGRLLDAPARMSIFSQKNDGRTRWGKRSEGSGGPLADMLQLAILPGQTAPRPLIKQHKKVRIILLDGTIVREWGAK